MKTFVASTPPREQLSAEWLACVETMERALGLQAQALQVCEQTFVEVGRLLRSGETQKALRLLETADASIGRILEPSKGLH